MIPILLKILPESDHTTKMKQTPKGEKLILYKDNHMGLRSKKRISKGMQSKIN